MNRLRLGLASTAAACLLTLAPAAAQEPADTSRAPADTLAPGEPDRPFVRGGIYDKPYLTRLAGRTAIGGYAEGHARWVREDGITAEQAFVAKRFNLFAASRVSEIVRFGAELEFEEGGEEIKLEFAAMDLLVHPAVNLRMGMLLSPLGRFNLSHDSPMNEFTDRPLVSTELLGVALSEPGLGLFGRFRLGPEARLTYEAYGVNGFHEGIIDESPDGTRLPAGRANLEDNNGSPAVVGRLAFSPRLGYELGVSAHHGAFNVFEGDGEPLDDRRDLTVLVLDAEAEVAGVRLAGEAATATIDVYPSMRGIAAAAQRGFYLEAVRDFGRGWLPNLPTAHFSAKTRVDAVDFDADRAGDSEWRWTLGVNFRPTADTALKLDYFRGWGRDRFNTQGANAGILFSLATYF